MPIREMIMVHPDRRLKLTDMPSGENGVLLMLKQTMYIVTTRPLA